MSDVSRVLIAIVQGDPQAASQLFPLVYDELRRVAARKLGREPAGLTLDATALVHEAYVRLVGTERPRHWDNDRHFFLAAAEAMRRVLIDHARRKRSQKHGGGRQRVVLTDWCAVEQTPADDLLALDEALARLATVHPKYAELVQLRYFAGLKITEAAAAMGISRATAERYWTFARTWLYCELSGEDDVQE